MITETAQTIGVFSSWSAVGVRIIEIIQELDSQCKAATVAERRQYVLGALLVLHEAYHWDMTIQDNETEETILWMFVQLFVR